MGFVSRLKSLVSRSQPAPDDDFWYEELGRHSDTGLVVTPDVALQASAVYACVGKMARALAMLPLITYERLDEDKKRMAVEHPNFRLLYLKPNPRQTSFEFREYMMGSAMLRGNAYAQKVMKRSGVITELRPLDPRRMEIKDGVGGRLVYEYTLQDNITKIRLAQDEVVHIKAFSLDGVRGITPIEWCRNTIGMTIAADKYGAKFFQNNAQPGGVLKHPGKLSPEAHKRIKMSWFLKHGGVENAHSMGILEEGMDWQSLGMNHQDSQFLESRQFQGHEICRLFDVPPHLVGFLDKATNNNIEHQGLDFLKFSLLPWLIRWEQALLTQLFDESEWDRFFVSFLVYGLERADVESRNKALEIQRRNGIISTDEWRRIEDMDPIGGEEGSARIVPVNMQTLEQATMPMEDKLALAQKFAPKKPGGNEGNNGEGGDSSNERSAFEPVMRDAIGRSVRRLVKVGQSELRRNSPNFAGFTGERQAVFESVRAVFHGFAALKPGGNADSAALSWVEQFLDRQEARFRASLSRKELTIEDRAAEYASSSEHDLDALVNAAFVILGASENET